MQLKSFADIATHHRHIFLSPHFDDAVYSCGGTLGVQVYNGLHPLVMTIFGGMPSNDLSLSPFAAGIHRRMGFNPALGISNAVETRRKEDATALNYLQCDYLWLDYLDAIYRGTPPYYTQESQLIGGDVDANDIDIDKQLAQDLLALQDRLPDVTWYAPLGIGRHVDHQIVTSAVDRLVQRGSKVYFYEDFPYILKAGAREARQQELGTEFEPLLVEMSELLPARIEASALYASQVDLNFSNANEMRRVMREYTHGIRPVQTVCLERYWVTRK